MKKGKYQINEKVIFQGKEVTIIKKIKGNKTKEVNIQGGIITGNKSNPCLYLLSNNYVVRGDKLIKINQSISNF